MGLIKRDRIEDKGTMVIERGPDVIRPVVPEEVMVAPQKVPAARTEAERIINDALKKADSIRQEARVAGMQEGKKEEAANIKESLTTLNQAVKERKQIIHDAESEVARLALKVAEQIIKSEVSLHRDVCLNIVSEAISRVSDREQIIVRVNREDAEYLKRYKDRLASMLDGVKSFSIIEDGNVEPGGCVIETNLGFIDAKISTKLKAIEEAFEKVSSKEEG